MSDLNLIPKTMIGTLQFRAEHTPDKTAYITGSDL